MCGRLHFDGKNELAGESGVDTPCDESNVVMRPLQLTRPFELPTILNPTHSHGHSDGLPAMRSSLLHRNFSVLWLLDHDHRHRVSIPAPSHLLMNGIIDQSVGTDTHPSQMLYPRILTAYYLGYQLPSNPVSVQDLSIAINA